MIQWNKVLKMVRDAEDSSIAVRDLATDLGLEIGDIELEKTINYLHRRGDISIIMGGTRAKHMGRVATITKKGLSRRELLGEEEFDDNPDTWADKYNKQIRRMKE